MKRYTLTLLALGAVLFGAGLAHGQTSTGTNPTSAPKQQKLVKVATLDSVKANQEFQANVQLLQAQRQAAIDLNTAMEKEKDAKKKKDMKSQIDAIMAKLNENNAAMQKIYGFSITRSYTMEVEKSNIYMLVSDEEAAKIDAEQKKNEADQKKKK